MPSSRGSSSPGPGLKPVSLVSPALVGGFFTTSAPWGAQTTTSPCPWRKGRFTKVNFLSSELAGTPCRIFSGLSVGHLPSRVRDAPGAALTQEPLSILPAAQPPLSAPPPSFLTRINHDLRRGAAVRGKPHPRMTAWGSMLWFRISSVTLAGEPEGNSVRVRVSVSSATQLRPTLCQAPLEFSRQEYWSGSIMALECHFLLQGIFLTQGSNLDLLHLFIFKKIYF